MCGYGWFDLQHRLSLFRAADDTLVYWSMWEATEPQGQVIQEAVDAYTEQTGVKVDLQFKGRTETVKHFSLH